jgi:general secretion pathway protein L
VKTVRVHLCPLAELGAETVLDYELLDAARTVLERARAVPAALPRLPRTELVLAAPDVLLVEAQPPRLSGSRLRAALPALAEPHLLSDIGFAFVASARSAGGPTTLAIVDRALLQRALELLRRLKITPTSATPEPLTLPLTPGRWRLRLGSTYACLRSAPLRGTVCSLPVGGEADGAPPVELRLALEQAGDARPQALEVEGACDTEAWSGALGVPVLPAEAPEARAEPAMLELLQYEFSPRLVSLAAWRVPAVLAALCALTWLIGLNVDAWLLRREEQALRAQMVAAVREVAPSVPVVLDAPAQMRRTVADLRIGAGSADAREFLPLAAALARALAAEPDAVRAFEFRDGTLRVDFEPRSLDAKKREILVEQLGAAGLAARFSEASLSVRAREGL